MDYDIDNLTNRYDSVGGNTLAYDAAGNLTTDKDGYQYEYDYENRITKITKDSNDIGEFAYDALGRRIKKRDSIANTNKIYYYNDNWQILCDYNDVGSPQSWFAYGNYIDEVVLMSKSFTSWLSARYYIQDHLYSPAALMGSTGSAPIERYEYDAYGNCQIMDASYNPRSRSLYGNPYYFTGRQLDELDGGNLKIQYNRNRYYDYYTGRWLTQDPLGIDPAADPHRSPFWALGQYVDGSNLYEYANTDPLVKHDPWGLRTEVWEGTIYESEFKPKDESYIATNPRMKYKVEMDWDCIGDSRCPDAYHNAPEITYQNLVGDLDSQGFSVIFVGVTVTNYVHLEGVYSRGLECLPRGRKCGTKKEVGFRICWKQRYSVGINPGLGPFSYDFGLSWGKTTTVRCLPKTTFIIDCCRRL